MSITRQAFLILLMLLQIACLLPSRALYLEESVAEGKQFCTALALPEQFQHPEKTGTRIWEPSVDIIDKDTIALYGFYGLITPTTKERRSSNSFRITFVQPARLDTADPQTLRAASHLRYDHFWLTRTDRTAFNESVWANRSVELVMNARSRFVPSLSGVYRHGGKKFYASARTISLVVLSPDNRFLAVKSTTMPYQVHDNGQEKTQYWDVFDAGSAQRLASVRAHSSMFVGSVPLHLAGWINQTDFLVLTGEASAKVFACRFPAAK